MTHLDEITAPLADPHPWREDDRHVVLDAVNDAAAANNGLVHAADVRDRLARDVGPTMPGAIICALVRQGRLVSTGRTAPNGDAKSRNRTKRAEVRRLTAPIDVERWTA